MGDIFLSAVDSINNAGRTAARAAARIARSIPSVETLVKDTVELSRSHASVKAGISVVRTASEMLGTIVDLIA